jgi:hypothetical protein
MGDYLFIIFDNEVRFRIHYRIVTGNPIKHRLSYRNVFGGKDAPEETLDTIEV